MRVSINTAVWTVMCSEPEIRAPLRGCTSAYSRRSDIRPGISCSAIRSSLRPKSASDKSAILKSMPFFVSADSEVSVVVIRVTSLLRGPMKN
ncbi:hypothetical protein I551_0322 [Mycobacterium ulcerans str. Harvey]|uniref:Uncharacterized protein n=1 Tax=Mycobacterium ulcerans str. Harvey TaxID=1299332 RepID=A0ABP3AQJ1_MYCUL|nr:hypothetical protein I551_0322 [Mycobacterium ulcerans str. Harvey]